MPLADRLAMANGKVLDYSSGSAEVKIDCPEMGNGCRLSIIGTLDNVDEAIDVMDAAKDEVASLMPEIEALQAKIDAGTATSHEKASYQGKLASLNTSLMNYYSCNVALSEVVLVSNKPLLNDQQMQRLAKDRFDPSKLASGEVHEDYVGEMIAGTSAYGVFVVGTMAFEACILSAICPKIVGEVTLGEAAGTGMVATGVVASGTVIVKNSDEIAKGATKLVDDVVELVDDITKVSNNITGSIVIKTDAAGNSVVSIQGAEMSIHASHQATQRGISNEGVANAMNQKPFQYTQNGSILSGFYDPSTNIFVGVGDRITTVIKPKNPKNYLNNLRNRQ